MGFSFLFSPLLKKAPRWQLPDPSQDTSFYGEVWVQYPLSDCLLPSGFGQVFKAKSEFRVIMNEFCQIAYSNDSVVTFDKAYKLLSQLQSWFDGLPDPLLPKRIVLPAHLQLQYDISFLR